MTTISKDRFLKRYVGFVLFFGVLSSFNVMPFLSADIQPWVVFLAVPGVLPYLINIRNMSSIEASAVAFISFLILYSVFGVARYGSTAIVNLLLYVCGPIFLVFFCKFSIHLRAFKLMRLIAWMFLAVALFELFVPMGIAQKIDVYSSAIVKRMWFAEQDSTRGLQLLFSEPSHAARAIWVLLLLFVVSLREMTKAQKFGYSAILAFLILTNSSATVYILSFGTALCYSAFNAEDKLKWLLRVFLAAIVTFVFFAILVQFGSGRVAEISNRLAQASAADGLSFEVLQVFGGIRLISEVAAAKVFIENPLGLGVGASQFQILPMLSTMGIDETNTWFISVLINWYQNDTLKPSSYFSQLLVDLGIFSVLMLVVVWQVFKRVRLSPICLSFFVMAVFQLVFLSTTSIPAPWIVLGLIASYGRYLRRL